METESEEREACLRRHRERDGARWASPTVYQTQARLEHNASYRHTHLQQLATNRQRRLESEMAEESYTPGGVQQAFVVANYHMTILHSSLHKYIHIVHELHCILRYICIYT